MRRLSLLIASLGVLLSAAGTWAQGNSSKNSSPQSAEASNPFAMWNVQQMIDRACGQIVKRYSLTSEQEEFIRNVMTTRVNAFLDKHEQPIREIFAEVIKYQMSGEPPPPEKVKEWTARVTPMFEEAKADILEGNREFREVLSDDQKKIHDIDLRIMEQNLKDAEKRLDRWREGGFDAEKDMGVRPGDKPAAQPQPAQAPPRQPAPEAAVALRPAPPAPAAPPQPTPESPAAAAAGAQTPPTERSAGLSRVVPPRSLAVDRHADFWELYVRKFIWDYKLDETQSNQALQILTDAKKQANEYLASHSMDYEALRTRLAGAAGDANVMAEVQKQIAELNKPIQVDMFNELKERLDRIPTEAQREAYFANLPGKKASDAPAGGAAASAPGTRPHAIASRPTTSRPATASRPALRRSPASGPATRGRTAASQPTPQR
jgi:hypothetical protein